MREWIPTVMCGLTLLGIYGGEHDKIRGAVQTNEAQQAWIDHHQDWSEKKYAEVTGKIDAATASSRDNGIKLDAMKESLDRVIRMADNNAGRGERSAAGGIDGDGTMAQDVMPSGEHR